MEKRFVKQPPRKKIKRNLREDVDYDDHHPSEIIGVDLSDDILDIIFSFLPMKSAFMVGALSTRFRDSWVFARNLDFGMEFARSRNRDDYIMILDQILKLHIGSKLISFKLLFNPNGKYVKLDEWIEFATKKKVVELDLDFCMEKESFKFPDSLLECESLRIMKISRCNLKVPPLKVKGLASLNTLVLKQVYVSEIFIKILFCNCLLLENLDLIQCRELCCLKICASNLKKFKRLKVSNCLKLRLIDLDSPTLLSFLYRGRIQEISMSGDVSKLDDVMLIFGADKGFRYWKNPFMDLSSISVLSINSTFLEGLRRTKLCLEKLKEFQLVMEPSSYCNLYDIALFMNNFPNLERVFLDVREFSLKCGLFWEIHDKEEFERLDCLFEHLKLVKVKDFSFLTEDHAQLVKFFLEKAINLETLALITPKSFRQKNHVRVVEVCEETFLLWRANPNIKIEVFGHSEEGCSYHPKHGKFW